MKTRTKLTPEIKEALRKLAERVEDNIKRQGRSVMMIGAGGKPPDDFPFCYTIGNHLAGLPELLLIGGCEPTFGEVLNVVSDKMKKRGSAFESGDVVDIGATCPVKVVDARSPKAKSDYMVQATNFLRADDYRVLQVLVPDLRGRFPGDPACDAPYALVPVLHGGH